MAKGSSSAFVWYIISNVSLLNDYHNVFLATSLDLFKSARDHWTVYITSHSLCVDQDSHLIWEIGLSPTWSSRLPRHWKPPRHPYGRQVESLQTMGP